LSKLSACFEGPFSRPVETLLLRFLISDTGRQLAIHDPEMKTVHLLLGSSERRLNSFIEATVLDVCYNRAAVQCTRTSRLGEFVRLSGFGGVDLMILAANHQLPEPGRTESDSEVLVQAVWTAKNQCSAPLMVLGVASELEYRIREAGADAVAPARPKAEELKAELNRILSLPAPEEPVSRQSGWSLAALFGRRQV
jgi:hypothetical protein